MKVFYDHQMFSWQKYGGITRYFCEIIKTLSKDHQFQLGLLSSENYYLKKDSKLFKKINILPNSDFKGKHYLIKKIYELNEQYSIHMLRKNNFDLFHPTYYNDYFFKYNKRPYVITVHDMINFKFEPRPYFKHEDIRSQMKKVVNKASRIIAISENTKNDLIDFLKVDDTKIDVIYHGVEQLEHSNITETKQNYILFVGERFGYKNFKNALNAVSKVLHKNKELDFLCVGKPFNKEEWSLIESLKIEKQISAKRVTNNELYNLYSNAKLFLFPSLYEGFGLTILEAFINNCPVCLSNSSCFPEIAGDAGVYFDPNSIESMTSAMEKLLYDQELAQDKIKKGRVQLKKFSWKESGMKTINTYQKALS